MVIPEFLPNLIDGTEETALSGGKFVKKSPHNGERLTEVARSEKADIDIAVAAADRARQVWSSTPPVQRGMILHAIVRKLQDCAEEVAQIVAAETGKSPKDARGEVGGAAQLGLFYASEGQRLYGKTTTSGTPNKHAMTVRQPIGIAGLIIAANTPIANVAWKVFPALICGNSAVLKAAEDTPATAWIFGKIAQEAGLPAGVLNIVQGLGQEAGEPLVEHPKVGVVSFTGSSRVGRLIAEKAGRRLARLSLELGGKNALVVCDDADLEKAANWVLLSAFSNAGQRCAAASRVIIFDSVYETFKKLLIEKTSRLKVGPSDADDFGPVINERQLTNILGAVSTAVKDGGKILTGGYRLEEVHGARGGYYIAPTLIENVPPDAPLSCNELFGPVAALYKVSGFEEALKMTNDSPYGLTACIHTSNFHRAVKFCEKADTGVVVVNAGTYGSEPHMPFGGTKLSGNGSREPGTEALDIYSELKDIYINFDPSAL